MGHMIGSASWSWVEGGEDAALVVVGAVCLIRSLSWWSRVATET